MRPPPTDRHQPRLIDGKGIDQKRLDGLCSEMAQLIIVDRIPLRIGMDADQVTMSLQLFTSEGMSERDERLFGLFAQNRALVAEQKGQLGCMIIVSKEGSGEGWLNDFERKGPRHVAQMADNLCRLQRLDDDAHISIRVAGLDNLRQFGALVLAVFDLVLDLRVLFGDQCFFSRFYDWIADSFCLRMSQRCRARADGQRQGQ